MTSWIAALWCALALAAPAAVHSKFSNDAAGENRRLSWTFEDERGEKRSVVFTVSAAAVEHDNQLPKVFPAENAAKAQARAVRDYADGIKGVTIQAKASKSGTLSISASGRSDRVRPALEGAQAAAEAELDRWLDKHRFARLRGDAITHDHARIAAEYADDVSALAAELGRDGPDARVFVSRALAFVQGIPYEKRKSGADVGFRRPLSVLARNKGDCDSKTTLFLALVRAAHPELASTVVYVPNHALAGVGTTAEAGERTFARDGVTYVAMEPVGPAKSPLGEVSGKAGWHLFWGSAQHRAVPPAQ